MCFPTLTTFGSFLLLFSFILQLFIIIAQLSNRAFINIIYFVSAWDQNRVYNVALWNYCTGTTGGNIQSCASPVPAYNWARTPGISDIATSQANSLVVKGLFLGMFILFFIGMGLSFLLWLMSLPICCLKHRAWGISMSTFVLINFLVTLTALILSLVLILGGIKSFTGGNSPWNAQAGNALWIAIGATVALFLAFLCYGGGSCCAGSGGRTSRRRRKQEEDYYYNSGNESDGRKRGGCCGGRRRKKNKAKVDPNYKETDAYIPGTTQPMYAQSPMYQNTGNPQSSMLQQPYVASSGLDQQKAGTAGLNSNYNTNMTGQTQGYDGYNDQSYTPHLSHQQNQGYDAAANTGMSYDPNTTSSLGDTAVGTSQQNYGPNNMNTGYQTPILEPANTHH
ncbi:SUR7/PalI family-domain-containing protein [Blakeslea trispora]|nr:SUR7/PalI family-domain-containing protein [Blakeslea trispora]